MPDPAPLHGLDHFDARIRAALAPALGVDAETLTLGRPREDAHGEFALPCFQFAKAAGCSPPELAQRLAAEVQAEDVRAGRAPDNYMAPSDLSDLERSHLRDAFVVIKTMQNAAGSGRGHLS